MLLSIPLDYGHALIVPEKFVPTFINILDQCAVTRTDGYGSDKKYIIQQGERVEATLIYAEQVLVPSQQEISNGS